MGADETAAAAAVAAAAAAAEKPAGDKPAAEKPTGEREEPAGETITAKPESKAGEGKPAPKAPEKYALTLPEGTTLDDSDVKRIEKAAREANLTNDDAQLWLQEQHEALVAQGAAYRAEMEADPDLGGDKLAETEKLARAAVDRLFPKGDKHREGFIRFITRGGAGNNINVVRAFVRIGKLMAEDSAVGGQGGRSKERDVTDVLYGHG